MSQFSLEQWWHTALRQMLLWLDSRTQCHMSIVYSDLRGFFQVLWLYFLSENYGLTCALFSDGMRKNL